MASLRSRLDGKRFNKYIKMSWRHFSTHAVPWDVDTLACLFHPQHTMSRKMQHNPRHARLSDQDSSLLDELSGEFSGELGIYVGEMGWETLYDELAGA